MRIRLAQPESDFPGIAELVSKYERQPVTIATIRKWFEHMPPGRITHRMVAVNEHDQIIGYSVTNHEPWWPDRHFYVWVGIDPQWRQRGLGLALYQDAEAFLQRQGAVQLKSEARDDDPLSLRFAQRNDFGLDRHLFASKLDLKTFDGTPYAGLIATQEAAGIRFFTVAEFQDSPVARRKLYELNRSTDLDIPGGDGTFMSFEEFEQWVCGAKWYCPAGQLIATDGEAWVGLSAVQLLPETQGAYNLMTGVLRPYRGRKIALALKLLAIRYARDNGACYISTDNDSLNVPMLAINKKLGYRPQPGKYALINVSDHA